MLSAQQSFLIRCPWDSNPRTEVLQTCTIDHSVRAPYITLSLVYKNSKKNQAKDYCDYLSFKISLTTYNIEQKETVWLVPFDYLIMIEQEKSNLGFCQTLRFFILYFIFNKQSFLKQIQYFMTFILFRRARNENSYARNKNNTTHPWNIKYRYTDHFFCKRNFSKYNIPLNFPQIFSNSEWKNRNKSEMCKVFINIWNTPLPW